MHRASWLVAMALVLATPTSAVYVSDVASQVICPCEDDCMKVLDVCVCGDAGTYRAQIDSMLVAGDSATDAREAFIAQYGERFRAAPRVRGGGLLLWILPVLFLLAGLIAVSKSVRRWSDGSGNKNDSKWIDISSSYSEQFEKKLRDEHG